jgi:hypothetical protein
MFYNWGTASSGLLQKYADKSCERDKTIASRINTLIGAFRIAVQGSNNSSCDPKYLLVTTREISACLISCTYTWPSKKEYIGIMQKSIHI